MTTDTEALIQQIRDSATISYRRHHASARGQQACSADSYDTHLIQHAYQAGHAAATERHAHAHFHTPIDYLRVMFYSVAAGALDLIYRIRVAAGDPEGKLMQDELVDRIAGMRATHEATKKGWK